MNLFQIKKTAASLVLFAGIAGLLVVNTACTKDVPSSLANDWNLSWKVTDLPNPESVVHDKKRGVLYTSNQNYGGEKGGASIGQLTLNGAIIEKEWVKGLNEPKGMLIQGNTLWVTDVLDLVEINIEDGEVVKRHAVQDAKFLNDIAADKAGNLYISDMFTSTIYTRSTRGEISVWMQSPTLENPNGLFVKGDDLYIAAWGAFNDGKPLDAPHGHLLKVSLQSKKIEKVSKKALGNLDGLQSFDQNSFLLSDWVAGKLYHYAQDTGLRQIADTDKGAGDLAYLKEQGTILVPIATTGEVLAYTRSNLVRPLGVRRNGSYYTRVEWSNATLNTPLYWVANINDDDTARNGGSWGAPVAENANVVLSFFGETQGVKTIRLFHNVGATISPLDELAKNINIYVSNDSGLQRIGDEKANLDAYKWTRIVNAQMEQKEGWVEFSLDNPVNARYIRVELVDNFGTPPERAFTETNEIQIFGE